MLSSLAVWRFSIPTQCDCVVFWRQACCYVTLDRLSTAPSAALPVAGSQGAPERTGCRQRSAVFVCALSCALYVTDVSANVMACPANLLPPAVCDSSGWKENDGR